MRFLRIGGRRCQRFVNDRIGGHRVGVRQQMGVCGEDRLRVIAEPIGDDVQRHRRVGRECDRRGRVAEGVQAADRNLGGLAVWTNAREIVPG